MILGLATALTFGCTPTDAVQAQTTRTRVVVQGGQSGTAWIGGAPVQTQVMVDDNGDTYVGVWVDAPSEVPNATAQRAPMALSLVIDTSGSMSGDKIGNARTAAASMIESLADGDIVSVFGFSNHVYPIANPTVVSSATRSGLLSSVNRLQAIGGTNLYGGLDTGVRTVMSAPATHTVRRVMVISDGRANVGPTDPGSMGNRASYGSEYGIQVTAIGVGLDYDQSTLAAMVQRSAGRFYHLQHPQQLATILDREVGLLSRTVATNAYIEIVPAPGVRIINGVTPGMQVMPDGKLRLSLGSIYAGQRRAGLFQVRLDTSAPGSRQLATARLVYQPNGTEQEAIQEAPLNYEVTRNASAARRSSTPRVAALVGEYQAAQAQERAQAAIARGDNQAARREYDFAQQQIEGAIQAAPASEQQRLRRRSTRNQAFRSRAAGATSAPARRALELESAAEAADAYGY